MIPPYNTGNPVPSYDPRDLDDNAEILDKLITGTAAVVLNRKGSPLKPWASIQQGAADVLQPALDAAARAELAAANAAASANQKPSIADGLATTAGSGPNNRFFSVPGEGNTFSIQYRNDNGTEVEIGRMVSAEVVGQALGKAEAAYRMAVPKSLSDKMPWGVFDKFMRAILAVKSNGTVHAILDRLPGLGLVGLYAWAVTDTNGVVLLGIKWSGEIVLYGQAGTTSISFVDGPVGGRDVFVLVDGIPYQVTSKGDNFSPSAGDGVVKFIKRFGPVTQESENIPVAGSTAAFIVTLLHIISSGQSLSMGATAAVVTTQPPTANRLFTIQDGVRLTAQSGTLTAGMVAPFKPLVAKTQEVPLVQLCAQLNRIRGLAEDSGVLASCHGRGGMPIASLSKGTLSYSNSITAATAAKAEADRRTLGYRVPFVDWIQGENDSGAAPGYYLSQLLQLQSDYETDLKAISGQSGKIPLLLDQISNWTAPTYDRSQSNVPFEQLQSALTYPDRFYCAGPKYWLPTSPDGVHLTSDSSMRLGAMHARAAQAILSGASWLPTHVKSATRSGLTVTLIFHTPRGTLAIDSVTVTDPGNFGIRYVDDTASASVQSVRLAGDNTVVVTLSAIPTGTNPFIGIADVGVPGAAGGPTTGARSCFRDSSTDLDAYGHSVFNWACHQRIPL